MTIDDLMAEAITAQERFWFVESLYPCGDAKIPFRSVPPLHSIFALLFSFAGYLS